MSAPAKKRKPLEEKILEGKSDLIAGGTSSKTKIKPPKKYLSAEQKGGGKLYAKQIYKETVERIIAHGCEDFVPKQLIENYAQVTARHIPTTEKVNISNKHTVPGHKVFPMPPSRSSDGKTTYNYHDVSGYGGIEHGYALTSTQTTNDDGGRTIVDYFYNTSMAFTLALASSHGLTTPTGIKLTSALLFMTI